MSNETKLNSNQDPHIPEPEPARPVPPPSPAPKRWSGTHWVISALVLGGAILVFTRSGRTQRKQAPAALKGIPVAVAKVTRANLSQDVVCEAEMHPFQEVDLHAKIAGYLDSISVDIGDRVKPGQVLARLEVPELMDDIKRDEAAAKRDEQNVRAAQAAYDQAHVVYTRLLAVDKAKPNLIAQQEIDTAFSKDSSAASALAAAKSEVEIARAELEKLKTMLAYSEITAPFAGVVTERYADPGALIQAGTSSSTQTLPIVRISENDRLRLDIPVSVSYVSKVHVGDDVEIRVPSVDAPFFGKIARTARKVETSTRTMKVEVDLPNPKLKLIPGMYASATLHLSRRQNALVVPVQAVSRSGAPSVFIVTPDNKLQERAITIGLETPDKIEVLAGLRENDLVLIGSRSQLQAGELVRPQLRETAMARK